MSATRTTTRPDRARLAWWLAGAAVLLLGLALRAAWYHAGYNHPDEVITAEVVGQMRRSGDWDTNWAKAPNLAADLRHDQYNFSSYLHAVFWFYRFVKLVPGTETWRSEDGGFWVYRFFSVLLAAAAVGQSWWLGRRVGGRGGALGAALLAAVSVQLVQDAHYARPESFVTVLTLAAVGLCWPGERFSRGRVMGGAFLVGLLVACKVSMLLLAWLPLVPLLTAGGGRWERVRRAGLPLAAMAAGFVGGVPGAVLHPQAFLNGVRELMTQYAGFHPPHSHVEGGMVADLLAAYYQATLGWPVVGAAVLGVAVLVSRRRWAELAMLAGPVAVFGGYFATRVVFFERNLSHVVPLFLILAAVGAMAAVEAITRGLGGRMRIWAGFGLLALMVVPALRITWPLLTVEFSGAGAKRHEALEAALRARHPGMEWKQFGLLPEAPLREIRAHFAGGGPPLLLKVTDYNDEWTARNLGLIAAHLEATLVADDPGTFANLPVCTLHTYLRPHDRYFLVTGLRRP